MYQNEPLDIVNEYQKEKQRRKEARKQKEHELPDYGCTKTTLPIRSNIEELESIGKSVEDFNKQLEGMHLVSETDNIVAYSSLPVIQFSNKPRRRP